MTNRPTVRGATYDRPRLLLGTILSAARTTIFKAYGRENTAKDQGAS